MDGLIAQNRFHF